MKKQIRVRSGKAQSVVGLVTGCVFILLGIFLVIPSFGLFGVFWTLLAVVITGANAVNVLSKRGIESYRVEVDEAPVPQEEETIERRFERLRGLYEQRLISEEEYQKKKEELLEKL